MISMVRALAVEFARHGIRAHAILPGWIETDMTAKAVASEGFRTKVLPRVPMRRWAPAGFRRASQSICKARRRATIPATPSSSTAAMRCSRITPGGRRARHDHRGENRGARRPPVTALRR